MPSKYGQRLINARKLGDAFPIGSWVIHTTLATRLGIGQVVGIDADKYLVNVHFHRRGGKLRYSCVPALLIEATAEQVAIEVASLALGLST